MRDSKASDQPAHTRSLIIAFASRLNIPWLLSYWLNIILSSLDIKEAAQACLSLHMSKCHIVGNHMSWLINMRKQDSSPSEEFGNMVFETILQQIMIQTLGDIFRPDLYVLGDDALISYGSYMQTKHLRVLIPIWIKGEVGAVKPV